MIVLGIEAATPVASVGIVRDSSILAERTVNNKKTHSVNLMPMIKAAIEDARLKPEDINGIAVSSGPGSFTGLRIGMAIAKTLSQAWGIPVTGISTLDVLAQSLAGHNYLICPLLNARKNEVYTGIYKSVGFDVKPLEGPLAMDVEELKNLIITFGSKFVFLGEAVPLYRKELSKSLEDVITVAPPTTWLPRGAVLAYLGGFKLLSGECDNYRSLLPHYIRLSEAEVKWQKKQKQ